LDDSMNFFFLPLHARTRSVRVKLSSAARYRRIVRKRKKDSYRVLFFFFFFVVVERCPRMIIARTAISSRWVVDPAVTSSRAVARNLAESRQRFFLFFFRSPRLASTVHGANRIHRPRISTSDRPSRTTRRNVPIPLLLQAVPNFRLVVLCLFALFRFVSIDRSIHPFERLLATATPPAKAKNGSIESFVKSRSFFLSPPPLE